MKNLVINTYILTAALLCGCAETKETTLYLQDLTINSPITHTPIFITKDPQKGQIRVVPKLSVATTAELKGSVRGHTLVNGRGIFHVDTIRETNNGIYFRDPGGVNTHQFTGKNLNWNITQTNAGLDIDLGLSDGVALAIGASYASSGGTGLWNYRGGLGFRSGKSSVAWRFDFGWQWQEHLLDYTTIVAERPLSSSASTVYFYHDREKVTDGSFYGALTVNSRNVEWDVNLFLHIGLTRQRVSEFKPKVPQVQEWIVTPFFLIPAPQNIVNDLRGEFASTLVHVTPGVYFDLSEIARLVCGIRLSFETGIEDRTRSLIVSPVLQFDFGL